jgi:hypothetical protein
VSERGIFSTTWTRLKSAGTFLLFAVLTVGGFAFAWALVPETKGRTLEQIEADMDGGLKPAVS